MCLIATNEHVFNRRERTWIQRQNAMQYEALASGDVSFMVQVGNSIKVSKQMPLWTRSNLYRSVKIEYQVIENKITKIGRMY